MSIKIESKEESLVVSPIGEYCLFERYLPSEEYFNKQFGGIEVAKNYIDPKKMRFIYKLIDFGPNVKEDIKNQFEIGKYYIDDNEKIQEKITMKVRNKIIVQIKPENIIGEIEIENSKKNLTEV